VDVHDKWGEKMSDLIYREDAIGACAYETFECYEARKVIRNLPSADRPQGEWIYCEDEYGIDGYRCSNCGRHIPWDYQHKFINFIDDYHTCPFCDARMKGADDE
jgi:DNA-directed RNA polymerase subunit RPC12/RpoP